jgi:hypothetical protein
VAGDQQRGDLQPAGRLVHDVFERLEHRGEVGAGLAEVEVVGKALEVDVGRVHPGEEFAARFGVDVARGDRDGLDAQCVAGFRRVDCVFGKDDGVVVGERHAAAARFQRCIRDG